LLAATRPDQRFLLVLEFIAVFCIQKNIVTGFFAAALLAATTAHAAETVDVIKLRMGAGNPDTGKHKSELCQGCHGENGIGLDDMVPNLAGQYAYYIAKELRNFQKGERNHQIMSDLAKTINDAELRDIATFFASQKMMQGNGAGDNPVGKKLFLKGDPSRKIPPCMSCHGVNGKGQAPNIPNYPVIGGQHKGYLRAQLVNWRSGERKNSPGNIMNKFAQHLTDAEIEALADYLSGL
jgi:cytochrome c553